MTYHYVWLVWSSGFLVPWLVLYLTNPRLSTVMWRVSLATATFGLIEPIWVPEYWNPPSLFELARRTGFDLESLIFCFAIGGIGAVLYDALTHRHFVPVSAGEKRMPHARFHMAALWAPYVLFVPLYFLPWNPIYSAILCLVIGAITSSICRPDLTVKSLVGGAVFLGLYSVFMLGLVWLAPGYIPQVWNLPALSGVLIGGIPLEELLFGFSFGWYWTGVYEHFTWSGSVVHFDNTSDNVSRSRSALVVTRDQGRADTVRAMEQGFTPLTQTGHSFRKGEHDDRQDTSAREDTSA